MSLRTVSPDKGRVLLAIRCVGSEGTGWGWPGSNTLTRGGGGLGGGVMPWARAEDTGSLQLCRTLGTRGRQGVQPAGGRGTQGVADGQGVTLGLGEAWPGRAFCNGTQSL